MSAKKYLILIRHAHRDASDRSKDNGLDEKGLEQAEALHQYFSSRLKGRALRLFSSPKKRCVESLQALGNTLNAPVEILHDLDEQLPSEDSRAMDERIIRFLKLITENKDELVLACSHGDWIPRALKIATDLSTSLGKAGWVELTYNGETWTLEEFVHSPKETEIMSPTSK